MCLASRYTTHTPGPQMKEELKVAGPGEKRLQISLNATAAQLHDKVLLTFPKLRSSGGYEYLKTYSSSST